MLRISAVAITHFTKSGQNKTCAGIMKCHTTNKSRIAFTVSPLVLNRLDVRLQNEHYASRNEAIQQAVEALLQRLECTRLPDQCALLDVNEEQAMADIGLAVDEQHGQRLKRRDTSG